MTVDTQKSLLPYLWTLLTGDAPPDPPELAESLQTIMGGTVRCYLTWAPPDAVFPYFVHRLDIRKEPGTHVIQRATYYLDIWSDSPNADEILLIRKRIIELLDELVFSIPTGEVSSVHIEIASDGFIPEPEQGIFHYATLWDLIFRRDSEANAINSR